MQLEGFAYIFRDFTPWRFLASLKRLQVYLAATFGVRP
jgi:hypothetical protein